jgi:hypothetical protein
MRKFVIAAALTATLVSGSMAAAQPPAPMRYDDRADRWEEDDRYDDRAVADLDAAQRRFDAAQARFDRERGLYERERRAYEDARARFENDRERLAYRGETWRGPDGQTYCRRPDGTTGTIVGGVAGGLIGRAIDGGRRSAVGTLLGAGAGALLGRGIERSGTAANCR